MSKLLFLPLLLLALSALGFHHHHPKDRFHHHPGLRHGRGHGRHHPTPIPVGGVPVNCSQVPADVCQLSKVPNVTFGVDGGSLTTSAESCCQGVIAQCTSNEQVCRDVAYYTIVPGQSKYQAVCPPSSEACNCQEHFSESLSLLLCPSPGPSCCPVCQCYGDPHCYSFKNAFQLWVICDDRDANCVSQESLCLSDTYDGKQCLWNHAQSYCYRDPNTPVPQIVMYEKDYRSYVNPNDQTIYHFQVTLSLGYYGSIFVVNIQDGDLQYQFGFSASQTCLPDPNYPFEKGTQTVIIDNLPSGVYMEMNCYQGSPRAQRWDILTLRDPYNINPPPPGSSYGGFCETGVINYGVNSPSLGNCQNQNDLLVKYLGCGDLLSCTNLICGDYASALQFPKSTCSNFIAHSNNGLAEILCALAVSGPGTKVTPGKCGHIPACRQCLSNIQSNPQQINQTLANAAATGAASVTYAPTSTFGCGNLLQTGLTRKELISQASGIEIDYQPMDGGPWTPVFAVFDSELKSCQSCQNPLYVNSSNPSYQALLNAGHYRIRHCETLSNTADSLCSSIPQYNISVVYANPNDGFLFGTPFGALFQEDLLICNPVHYPNCPENYKCCMWDPKTQSDIWKFCMLKNYGASWASFYPNCS